MEETFALLGWRVKATGAKALPFAKVFTTLGAVIDLSSTETDGLILVANKPERQARVQDFLAEIIKPEL
eukprot:3741860-Heterocapsa_arctica.AAC.1